MRETCHNMIALLGIRREVDRFRMKVRVLFHFIVPHSVTIRLTNYFIHNKTSIKKTGSVGYFFNNLFYKTKTIRPVPTYSFLHQISNNVKFRIM